MKLIPNWRKAWRMHSIRFAAVLPVLSAMREAMPEVQAFIPAKAFGIIVAVLGVVIIFGRLIHQDKAE